MIKIGALVSGEGTNLQAIFDAIAKNQIDGEVSVVVSNIASAGGLERARKANVPAIHIDHRRFGSRKEFDASVVEVLVGHKVDYVVLAGFMRVVTQVLLDAFPMRVLNIHPALLPAFPGLNAQMQAMQYGARVTGCTVHFVDSGTDTGPVIAQAVIPIVNGDDEDKVRSRLIVYEHFLLTSVLQWLSEGRVSIKPGVRPNDRPRVEVEGVHTAYVFDLPMAELVDP